MSKKLFILIVFIGFSLTSFGQRGGRGLSPEKIAERQTAKLQERLSENEMALNEEELAAAKALHLKYAEKAKLLRQENKGDREAMRAVMEDVSADMRAEFKKLLSKAQFKAYKKLVEEQKAERRAHRGRPEGD